MQVYHSADERSPALLWAEQNISGVTQEDLLNGSDLITQPGTHAPLYLTLRSQQDIIPIRSSL